MNFLEVLSIWQYSVVIQISEKSFILGKILRKYFVWIHSLVKTFFKIPAAELALPAYEKVRSVSVYLNHGAVSGMVLQFQLRCILLFRLIK